MDAGFGVRRGIAAFLFFFPAAASKKTKAALRAALQKAQ
jgi:hypothetical protein